MENAWSSEGVPLSKWSLSVNVPLNLHQEWRSYVYPTVWRASHSLNILLALALSEPWFSSLVIGPQASQENCTSLVKYGHAVQGYAWYLLWMLGQNPSFLTQILTAAASNEKYLCEQYNLKWVLMHSKPKWVIKLEYAREWPPSDSCRRWMVIDQFHWIQ